MSSENLLAIWEDLEVGIQAIFNMENIGRESYMNLYSQVYNYCTFVDPKNVSVQSSSGVSSKSQNGYPGNFHRSHDNNPSNQNGAKLIGWELYKKLKEYLKLHVIKLKSKGDGKTDEEMLKFVQLSWTQYSFSVKVLNGVCMYLNRNWVKRQLEEGHKQFHDIYTCALLAWTENLLRPHQNVISEALIKEVEKERLNEQLNHRFLKPIIDCLVEVGRLGGNTTKLSSSMSQSQHVSTTVQSGQADQDLNSKMNFDLSVYTKIFETPFIKKTERFYRIESMDFLGKNEITDYLKRVEQRMVEEEQRINSFIHFAPRTQTLEKLNETLTKTLLSDHLDRIINEFTPLLAGERVQDLSRMFGLLYKIPDAFVSMTSHFENFVYQKGSEAISSKSTDNLPEPKVYIETILDVYKQNYATVTEAFHSEIRFLKALDKGCERFINKNAVTEMAKTPRKTPEFLAKYCDMLLKKSSRDTNTDDLDEILSRFMTVFKYIEDKDVFQGFYSKMLARRLINDLSISEDIEAAMISRLKESCGYEYTAKLQRMFSDKSTSRDLNSKFLVSPQNKSGNIDLNVMVLSSNSWPYTAQEKFTLPQELIPCYQSFIDFFNTAHTGRKLSWCFNLGRGEVVTNYTKKTYIFQVSTYQIAILLLFNKSLSYSVKEITDATQLDSNIVIQILQIFLRGKVLIVNGDKLVNNDTNTGKSNDTPINLESEEIPDIGPSTIVHLYTDYKNKRIRVNLNLQLKGETKQEVEEVISRVDHDRRMAIDACIVRVMKTRKTLKHQELVREVLEQLSTKFNPQVALIKRCIAGLIEKEYLKRDNNCKDTYQYLA